MKYAKICFFSVLFWCKKAGRSEEQPLVLIILLLFLSDHNYDLVRTINEYKFSTVCRIYKMIIFILPSYLFPKSSHYWPEAHILHHKRPKIKNKSSHVIPQKKIACKSWRDYKKIALEQESKLLAHAQTLVKQGHLLSISLSALEKSDVFWKSYMFYLKKGTMKFLLNACLDTLPTKTNLLQWGNWPQTCASYD